MKRLLTLLISLIFVFSQAPNAFARGARKVSQLERRQIETRFFETSDTERVMRAAVNTLQDSGFIIQEIEPQVGYLRAEKSYKMRQVNKARLAGNSLWLGAAAAYTVFSYGSTASYMYAPTMHIANEMHQKTVVVDTNVNVEKFGKDKTKVRFVLVQKVLLNADGYSYVKSAPTRILRVYNPKVYQEFFNQLDKNVFYEGI
jgi:hypothetical protein